MRIKKIIVALMVACLSFAFISGAFAIGDTVFGVHNGHAYSLTHDGSSGYISSELSYAISDQMKLSFTPTVQFNNIGGGVTTGTGTFSYGTFYTNELDASYTTYQACAKLNALWFSADTVITRCVYKAYINYSPLKQSTGVYPV